MHRSLCLVVGRCLFCIGECVYLLGWLVSWCELVVSLVGQSVGRSVGRLVGWLLVSWSVYMLGLEMKGAMIRLKRDATIYVGWCVLSFLLISYFVLVGPSEFVRQM